MPDKIRLLALKETFAKEGESVLDLGIGKGYATGYFVNKGCHVTAIGLYLESYGINKEALERRGVRIIESDVDDWLGQQTHGELGWLPFHDESFQHIWCSHILEHTAHVGRLLSELWRILKDDGWLYMIVPPPDKGVAGGHLTPGWSLGQLMYLLVLHGFNVSDGHYLSQGYNRIAFVQKGQWPRPGQELRHDNGDLELLEPYWPEFVRWSIINGLGFPADLPQLNWPPLEND